MTGPHQEVAEGDSDSSSEREEGHRQRTIVSLPRTRTSDRLAPKRRQTRRIKWDEGFVYQRVIVPDRPTKDVGCRRHPSQDGDEDPRVEGAQESRAASQLSTWAVMLLSGTLSQSAKNLALPLSVSGWCTSLSRTLKGTVATSEPTMAT